VGQNITAAVAKIGYPDGERTILGAHLYVFMPVSTTAFAKVGGTTASGAAIDLRSVSVSGHCRIQLAVDDGGTIKSFQWDGNRRGCAPHYSHRSTALRFLASRGQRPET